MSDKYRKCIKCGASAVQDPKLTFHSSPRAGKASNYARVTQTSNRVSMTQLHHLWEFLDHHREIAVGFNKSTQARDHSRRMWEKVAEILNSTGDGVTKSSSEWSKYWVDFKAKLKRKNRLIIESQTRTGGEPATNLELTEIERKFLSIFGADYGAGLPGVRVEPLLSQDIQEDIAVPSNPDTSQSTATEDTIFIVVPSSEELQSRSNEATTSAALQQRCQTPIRGILSTPVDPQPLPSRQGATGQGARRRLALPVQAEPSPIAGQASSEQVRTRRRSRQGQQMSAADARERLVRSSEMRSQAEMNNSRSIERAVDYLSGIVAVLRNIQSGLSDAVARGASQGPPS